MNQRALEYLQQCFQECGLVAPEEFDTTGEVIRFGKKNTSWYVLHEEKNYYAGSFGDWKLGGGDPLSSVVGCFKDGKPFDDEFIKKEVNPALTEKRSEEKKKKVLKEKEVAKIAHQIIKESTKEGVESHPYILKKEMNVGSEHNLYTIPATKARRILKEAGLNKVFGFGKLLVIPMWDIVTNKLVSVQFITENGSKQFLKGAQRKNTYSYIGKMDKDLSIYVVEGLATGDSIYQSKKGIVVIAFTASGLHDIVKELRKKYDNEIIVCADNDQFTVPENGIVNPGVYYAKKILNDFGVGYVIPEFEDADLESQPTDFNDLKILYGIEMVEAYLDSYDYDFLIASRDSLSSDYISTASGHRM